MRLSTIISACFVVLFAFAAAQPQAVTTPDKKTVSDAVKCWAYADADGFFKSASADESTIFAPTDKGSIIAVSAASGNRIWRADFGGEVVSNVAVGDSRIAVATRPSSADGGSKDTTLRVLSKETGIIAWKAEIAGSGTIFLKTAGNIVVAAASSGEVSAFDLGEDALKWKLTFAGGLSAEPVVEDQLLAVATGENRIAGVTLTGGESRFSIELKRPARTLFLDGGSIFAGDSRGEVVRFDIDAVSDRKWRYRAGAQIGSLGEHDGSLIAASYDNFLYALGTDSGHVNWKVRMPARVLGSAALDGKRLLVLVENSATASVVMAETGRIDSQVDLGEAATAAGTSGGRTFVVSPTDITAYGAGSCTK